MIQPKAQTGNATSFPRYGQIVEVSLDPVIGAETGKRRPALVISNDINNQYAATVTVLPITSVPSRKIYPFQADLPKGIGGLTEDSRVKCEQIRTIDKSRIVAFWGQVPDVELKTVMAALKVHLSL
ncbi:MAG: type II toxin-antitoxin system PemK/MazF family toxin [Chloroflexi bacterium]|nr:type II toxin-antitoxin system PemK/MazF family toxin [Chloroflexota bacterium]